MRIEYCPNCDREQYWRALGGGVRQCPGCGNLFGLYNRRTHQHKGAKKVTKSQPEIAKS